MSKKKDKKGPTYNLNSSKDPGSLYMDKNKTSIRSTSRDLPMFPREASPSASRTPMNNLGSKATKHQRLFSTEVDKNHSKLSDRNSKFSKTLRKFDPSRNSNRSLNQKGYSDSRKGVKTGRVDKNNRITNKPVPTDLVSVSSHRSLDSARQI